MLIMNENKNMPHTSKLSNSVTTVESYSFETISTVKELVYTWKIKNFSHTYLQPRHCVSSPKITTEFKDNEWVWFLEFCPNGLNEGCEGWSSLNLCLCTYATKQDQQVYLKLCIIDKLKKEYKCYENFFTFYSSSGKPNTHLSLPKFVTKKKISELMIDQDLEIVCKMYLNESFDNSVVYTNLISKESMPVDQRMAEFDDFEKLLDSEKFSDVKLTVGEKEFFAHKNILATRSKVFAAMFAHDMKENNENVVTITDVRTEIMQEVLRFIYSGKVNDIESVVDELLAAADKYQLDGLKLMCQEMLIGKLSKETLNDILVLVDRYDIELLCNATIHFITLHASELSSVDSFKATIKKLSSSLLSIVIEALMLKI